jgi:hypothetical protein
MLKMDKIQGRIALWDAQADRKFSMTGKLTVPVEMLTELMVIAGDLRSEVEIPIVLWDNSSSTKPGSPRYSGYGNLPAEPKAQPTAARSEPDYDKVPF